MIGLTKDDLTVTPPKMKTLPVCAVTACAMLVAGCDDPCLWDCGGSTTGGCTEENTAQFGTFESKVAEIQSENALEGASCDDRFPRHVVSHCGNGMHRVVTYGGFGRYQDSCRP